LRFVLCDHPVDDFIIVFPELLIVRNLYALKDLSHEIEYEHDCSQSGDAQKRIPDESNVPAKDEAGHSTDGYNCQSDQPDEGISCGGGGANTGCCRHENRDSYESQ